VKRHDIDAISLVFGLMFTAAGALFMSANLDFSDIRGEWVWPIPFVVVGIVLLVSALARREDEPVGGDARPEPMEEPETEWSESEGDEAL
jgi:hypothetical protein